MKNIVFWPIILVLFLVSIPAVSQLLKTPPTNKIVHQLDINPKRTILFDVPFNTATVEKTIETISDLNKESSEPIYLLLDSPGGYVDPGLILISAIESSKAPVYTIVYRFCASMCAFTHQYGKERYMIDRSIILFHPISGAVEGTTDGMDQQLKFVLNQEMKLLTHIADRAGMNPRLFKALRRDELTLEADDAELMGLTDKIVAINYTRKSFNTVISTKVAKVAQKLPINATEKTRTPAVN